MVDDPFAEIEQFKTQAERAMKDSGLVWFTEPNQRMTGRPKWRPAVRDRLRRSALWSGQISDPNDLDGRQCQIENLLEEEFWQQALEFANNWELQIKDQKP